MSKPTAPTPGPWSFEAENGRAHPRVYGHDNSLIAEVGNAILMRWEEWDANARLIAAAPAMLATLKDIAAGNVPPGFLNGVELEDKAHFQERLACWMQNRAHAAIALTEDREPVTPTEATP